MADAAIAQELALITRYPPGSARLLAKRSKANAHKELWRDSLEDADQVKTLTNPLMNAQRLQAIKMDVLLHSLHRYQEATEALRDLLTRLEGSPDPGICRKSLWCAF